MRRFLVPGIPAALSLGLSIATVGTTVYWQDSGFFLAGVKELGVLYPPGFVLYLISCKVWTLLLGFLDFTLAVHLFSSVCAAGAAGAIAMAARECRKEVGEIPAIVAGCLAAAGFTFWSSAILAKGYALLYLILSLLMWRMIRSNETGKPRDFTIVAVLIGLAWAAHPSATGIGLAFLLFVVAHRRTLGGKGIAVRTGIAAAAAIAPSLLLPILADRDPSTMFGQPSSLGEWLRYLRGGRFTELTGVFGWDGWRVLNAAKYLWEDFLGVGLLLALVGLSRLAVVDRKLLLAIGVWVLPAASLATLFRIEGQQDLWLVAAWLPLHLAVALGLSAIPERFARAAVVAIGVAGLGWSIAANVRAVSMRDYTLAERFGRFHLEPVDRDAILILESDDALATARYLQVVKGIRRDVLIVDGGRLGQAWYEEHLRRRDLRLRSGVGFAQANVSPERPVYFESGPPDLPNLAPAGPLLRMAPPGLPNEPRLLEFPVKPEEARARAGRERGIRLQVLPDGLVVEPEPYEHRWVAAYVRAQARQGQLLFQRGGTENLRKAAALFESARVAEPGRPVGEILHLEGVCHYLLKDPARAEPLLKSSLHLPLGARQRLRSCVFLSNIYREQGRVEEARRYHEQAMAAVGSDPELRREFEQSSRPK